MTNSEARKRHATPPTPDALALESLREDIRSVLDEPNPDPTAEWWADKADLLLAALDEARAEAARFKTLADARRGIRVLLRRAEARATAAESARDAAEGAIERVRLVIENWDLDQDQYHVGAIHAEILRDLHIALAPVTTDETEGGGVDE